MSRLVQVPTGEMARRIAEGLCKRLDAEHGKRSVASHVRDMLWEVVADADYHGKIGSEKFIGWMRGLGILYKVPYCSWYGLRTDWRDKLAAADFDTAPGKFGSLRPELQVTPKE